MADAVISFAVEKLGDALIEKVMFLKAVEDEVRWVNGELQSMQSFLTDAAEKQAKDERISRWISDIREVALDAEDAIGIFVLKVENTRRNRGPLGGSACLPAHAYHLNRVGEEIQSIRKRLDDIRNRRQTYAIKNLGEGTSTVLARRSEDVERRRRLSPWEKDKHLVGLDDDVQVLLQKLNLEKKTNGLSIGAIVGMGGIGKSTLARKIYNHDAVANQFECRAWVVVSSAFTLEETIKQVILELHKSTEDKITAVKDIQVWEVGTTDKLFLQAKLKEMLHKQLLGKSYFIVLDDVWEREHWESLVSAFPNEQDKSGRLLFTSRNDQIITQYDGYVHKMKFLNDDESWELLMKTAFNSRECPQEVEETGKLILRKCEGLPLPITVAGVLLPNLQGESKNGWQKILDRIDDYPLGISRKGNNIVSSILELSYRNLPPQLKTCFLCLGFFKEGATIRAKKLIRIWVAQGFIKQEGGKTMEETARGYLNELINRNLVQVKEMNIFNSEVRSCGVHDLLHELSVRKAKEEISFEIVNVEKDGTCSLSQPNPRHHAIYFGDSWQLMFIDSSSFGNQRRLRSLFFHQNGKSILDINPSYWKNLELLRVLDFEEYSNLQVLPEEIGSLIGLRYLGLRGTKISYLPRSICCLKNLEVLDAARLKFILRVPNVIWRIYSLRHLYIDNILIFPYFGKIETLKNIETLKHIGWKSWIMVKRPAQMTSLRKLGIRMAGSHGDTITNISTSLALLPNLTCLNLIGHFSGNFRFDELQRLTKLKLSARMTSLPCTPDHYPPNLSYLSLIDNSLEEDPMPVLEKLPNLLCVKLESAYEGTKMVITPHGFPKLKLLSLYSLHKLVDFQVGEGGMPELRQLEIYNCQQLKIRDLHLPEPVIAKTVFVNK